MRFTEANLSRLWGLLFGLALWSVQGTALCEDDAFRGPWNHGLATGNGPVGGRQYDGAVGTFVELYRRYLSPVDGSRCPMHPGCSQYALDSFGKHGLFKGWVLTCDRLMRCGRSEISRVPAVWAAGRKRYYDPVENNDFWWFHER